MNGPQLEDGYLMLANETVEALSRTNLSPYEWRFLMVLFRKTYGWAKKDDWIALSQIVEMTGMHKAHVSRAKKKLLDRNIVTQTGNRIAFNKYHTQWRELPKLVTVTQTGNKVTSSGNDGTPKQVTTPPPKQAHTKDTSTKDTITKESGSAKNVLTDDEAWARFRSLLIEQQWCDEHYATKTWDQGRELRGEDRVEFMRKVRLVVATASGRPAFAKKIYHEIAGLVSDRGAMNQRLTPQEKQAREIFKEEMGQSLDDA